MVVEYKKEAQLYKIQLESEGNTPGSCQPTYSGEMLKLQNTNAALSQEISSLKNQIAVASLTQTPTDQELVTRCHKLEYDLVDQQKKNKRLEAELIQSCRAATQPTPADSAVLAKELSKCRKENILVMRRNCG